MEENRKVMRRVGAVLLTAGIIDVLVMVYCIAKKINYSSSFNIFAIIAGIFLLRGSLRAVRAISMISAFMMAAFLGLIFMLPVIFPTGLLTIYYSLHPVYGLMTFLVFALIEGFLFWTYRSLTPLLAPAAFFKRPSFGFLMGVCAIIFLSTVYTLARNMPDAKLVIETARKQGSPDSRYFISTYQQGRKDNKKYLRAKVMAYKPGEIKSIDVDIVQ